MTTSHRLLLPVLVVWALAAWFGLRPDSIVADWNGWRQSDTQTVALNTQRPEATFNVPIVNWGGTEPRAVEAEFQLYTAIVGVLLSVVGDAEWPGQLVSMLALIIAALAIFGWLRERYGERAAWMGLALFLASRCALFLGTSIQPDSLAIAAFVLGWIAFDRWVQQPSAAGWALWVSATLVATLVKITNLQIGIAQFLFVVLAQPWLLRHPLLWLGWATVLGANVLQVLHGAAIYAETGLTFGIASGGDSKFPSLHDLTRPGHYIALMKMTLAWGLTPLGVLALFVLIARRRFPLSALALGIGHAIGLLIALRYTTQDFLGSHYHAPATLIGVQLVAAATAQTGERGWKVLRYGLPTLISLIGLWNIHARLTLDRPDPGASLVALAETLKPSISSGTPVAVRSEATAQVPGWRQSVNNYEDPRLLYLLRSPGFELPRDALGAADIEQVRNQGARWFIVPAVGGESWGVSDEQQAWLTRHSRQHIQTEHGDAWQLQAQENR